MNRPAVRFVPSTELLTPSAYSRDPHTGQLTPTAPLAPTSSSSEAEQHSFFDALRGVTPALIATGIAIGIASGIGTTVGSTIGTLLLERFQLRKERKSRR